MMLGVGYLPVCGPAPLRWQPPAKPVAGGIALPPLPAPSTVAQPPMPPPVDPAPQLVEAGGQTNMPLVTPEMWLELLRKHESATADAPGTGVIIPFGFTPPVMSAPSGSRAVYKTR